ncbi:MAG: hypothetical protein JST39_14455 [Bacteroidetes bacterium]|nr:hypothetical protein [Bacteroidota bacterium]
MSLSLWLLALTARSQSHNATVVTDDIAHFWQAYDQITATQDTTRQLALLQELFIARATAGQQAMMKARNYTPRSYIEVISRYPRFWQSIRPNMSRAGDYAGRFTVELHKLQSLYPALRPAKIYFTVGAFRSGGTTMDSMVLIGSEISMVDSLTETSEIAQAMPALATFMKTDPLRMIVFTNVHEYVHTQQKTTSAGTLLGQCLLEGVAEFMAEKATGLAPVVPCFQYGRTHAGQVRAAFTKQLFNTRYGYWLYNNDKNEFGNRDMGYYAGYALCEAFYNKAKDKRRAIAEMIELDYDDQKALAAFIDRSGYFTQPASQLKANYEASRPYVTGVQPPGDSTAMLDTSQTRLTIRFSAPMDKRYRNFELGPMGKGNLLHIKRFIGFDEDGRSATIEVELDPGRHYQLVVGDGFRDANGISLRPFLIDFQTRTK